MISSDQRKRAEAIWTSLFPSPQNETPHPKLKLLLLFRNNHPFLFLPADGPGARAALDLYSPFAFKARCLKRLLLLFFRTPCRDLIPSCSFNCPGQAPLWQFIASLHPEKGPLPSISLMAGNPRSSGQRFILLLMDKNNHPLQVVKAGITPEARHLIDHEHGFLAEHARKFAGLPRITAFLEHPQMHALALNYVPGSTPLKDNSQALGRLVSSWFSPGARIVLQDIPAWQRLWTGARQDAPRGFSHEDGRHSVARTLCHGDLAPWNIRVNEKGDWVALDWERGEKIGVPGWDWFHFHIQSRILGTHTPVSTIVSDLENLLLKSEFQAYAKAAGISGIEKPLVMAYLWHVLETVRPADGTEALRQLRGALMNHWKLGREISKPAQPC